jgi:hypothetical protein
MSTVEHKPYTTYSVREWLNPNDSASTGSVCAFHGESTWISSDGDSNVMFLEIADCHGKSRIHMGKTDTPQMFVEKLRKLTSVITDFADFIEKEHDRIE